MDPSINIIKRVHRGVRKSDSREHYDFEENQANNNVYAGSVYATPNYNRKLESIYDYEYSPNKRSQIKGGFLLSLSPEFLGVVSPEYYTPIDRDYQISRKTNCMGGSPRLPGLLPCPYGTDAIACASYSAGQERFGYARQR